MISKCIQILGLAFLAFSAAAEPPSSLWQEDLIELQEHLEAAHPDFYHSTNTLTFSDLLKQAEQEHTPAGRYISLARALATVGDGHTAAPLLPMPIATGVNFKFAPLQFKVFSDGVFLIASSHEHEALIGRQLVSVNGMATETMLKKIRSVVSSDNPYWTLDLSGYYLSNAELVNTLSEKTASAEPSYEFAGEGGNSTTVIVPDYLLTADFKWIKDFYAGSREGGWRSVDLASPLPDCQRNYCREVIHAGSTLYLNIRSMQNDETSFSDFVDASFDLVENNNIKNVIIDLRLNRGGNGSMRWPLIYKLVNHKLNSSKHLVVLISNKVFSAGMMLAVDLERHTNAVFIGED